MPSSPVTQVSCIVIDGADARRFAQAQFSGDVQALPPGHWQWNAWLDPQGRVAALMHLVDPGDGRLLAVLRGGDAERVREGLSRYLLRAKARLAVLTCAGYADPALATGQVEVVGKNVVLGYGERSLRLGLDPIGATPDAIPPVTPNAWRLTDIRAGWPVLPAGEARFLPPALGLERLGAVSFDKGCYPGQEIAARLHYRGGHKPRLHHVRGTAPLPSGVALASVDAGAVHVLDSANSDSRVEALVVAHQSDDLQINILDNLYDVISIFDA